MSKIKCKKCGEILESKHRHDFVSCGCDNKSFVDGVDDYVTIGAEELDLIEVLCDAECSEDRPT